MLDINKNEKPEEYRYWKNTLFQNRVGPGDIRVDVKWTYN